LIERQPLAQKDYDNFRTRLNVFCSDIQVVKKLQTVIQDGEVKLLYLDKHFFLMLGKEWFVGWLNKLKTNRSAVFVPTPGSLAN